MPKHQKQRLASTLLFTLMQFQEWLPLGLIFALTPYFTLKVAVAGLK
jgi:hypothetical protein